VTLYGTRRRSWLAGLLATFAAPAFAQAQPPAKPFRIGLLGGSSPTSAEARHVWAGFFDGLREFGYVEGRDFVVEGHYYGDRADRLPTLAAELVALRVAVIVAGAPPAPEAARRATSTIPLVMAVHNDPVGAGLVASLARPGGNVTGLSLVSPELRGKQLQLLKETIGGLARVAVLVNPAISSNALDLQALAVASRALKLQLEFVEAPSPDALAPAFAAAGRAGVGAMLVLGGTMYFAHRVDVIRLAGEHRLPVISAFKEYAEAGGLMAYGADVRDSFRRAAGYVDRILKGAKPADLPVEQPTKFELTINMRTARALGLTIPPPLLARADRIIE
jgi:putative ABC transport system substrate-binding protein